MPDSLNKDGWLHRIVKITESIYNTYYKLSKLEIEGKKDSEEYQKLLDLLSIAIESEQHTYSYIKNDYDACRSSYIGVTLLVNAIDDEKAKEPFKRIYYQLEIFISDLEAEKIGIPKSILETKMQIRDAVNKDYIYGTLYFLQEYIKSDTFAFLKNYLISGIYETCYNKPIIEQDMIKKSFNIPETLYFSSRLIAGLRGEDSRNFIDQQSTIIKVALSTINELLEIKDISYNDNESIAKVILIECCLRSCLLLMSDKDLEFLESTFNEIIKNKEFPQAYPDSYTSKQIILDCFTKHQEDKSKVYEISGPKRS